MKNVQTSWKVRRIVMFIIGLFSMSMIIYINVVEKAGKVAEMTLDASFFSLYVIMAVYVFGVITDENISKYLDNKIIK